MKKEELEKRIKTGKQEKSSYEEKEKLREQKLKERFDFEETWTGGYELIFPSKFPEKMKKFESFLTKANNLWDEFTTGKLKK